jgi:hypothetical protein
MGTTAQTVTTSAVYEETGAFFSEESTVRLADGDLEQLKREAVTKAPQRAYAFRLQRVVSVPVEVDGHTEQAMTRPLKIAGAKERYFLGGDVFTADTLPAEDAIGHLQENMECNGWTHVVRTPFGNYQPFEAAKEEIISR